MTTRLLALRPACRWLTPGRALLFVAAISGALHLLALLYLPLMVTPDGQEYIVSADALLRGVSDWCTPFRTPGYPALLATAFAAFGRDGTTVLVMNHLVAWGTCVAIAALALRLGGSVWGLLAGLAFALDPWSLVFSTYTLSEIPTVAVATAGIGAALCVRRASVAWAAAIGVILAAGCLMRPALQVLAPFVALAWLVAVAPGPRRASVLAVWMLAGFAAASAPWLWHNHARGVSGFARGANNQLFYGAGLHGLLDPDYPLDDRTRESFERNVSDPPEAYELQLVIDDTRAKRDAAADLMLGNWARASIGRHPGSYAVAAFHTLLWQLNCGIAGQPRMYDEMRWLTRRIFLHRHKVGRRLVAPNFQGAAPFPGWRQFSMDRRGTIFRPYLLWWADGHLRGVPQVPLFLLVLIAVPVAACRRRWPLAILFAGSLVFLAAHCALLGCEARFSMPIWPLWYLAAAWVLDGGGRGLPPEVAAR